MKTAIVTGGTRGIGKSISEMYLRKGYFVIINYRQAEDACIKFLEDNKEFKDNIYFLKKDLSSFENVELFIQEIKSLNRKIDALVLNVGVTKRETFGEVSIDSWKYVFDSNLTVPFFIVQGLVELMNLDSHVTFISSVLGVKADSVSIPYGVTKGSVSILIQYLAKACSERRIRFNSVAPGFIDTEWHLGKSKDLKENIENKTLCKRFGKVEEVSSVCSLLEENLYINGQTFVVDGGYVIK